MSKRKTSALRKDSRYNTYQNENMQTFYANESKTIKFDQVKVKPNNKPIVLVPKSLNQEKYILALMDEGTDIVVVSGPAGTGKTYLAMQSAIKALRDRKCDRIILSRPAVGVDDEKHGF